MSLNQIKKLIYTSYLGEHNAQSRISLPPKFVTRRAAAAGGASPRYALPSSSAKEARKKEGDRREKGPRENGREKRREERDAGPNDGYLGRRYNVASCRHHRSGNHMFV